MGWRQWAVVLAFVFFFASLDAQTHHPRHLRYPNSMANDPQLVIPADQAQACYAPDGERSRYEQYQQFDTFPLPASKGYLCIAIPTGGTFVIDHIFAEADYDQAPAAGVEWYLDSIAGNSEAMIGLTPNHAGALTGNPHYLLSQTVHIPVEGGTRLTLIMHNTYVSSSVTVGETPGTASLLVVGHWE